MDKLTLDTNIVNDWAWAEGKLKQRRYNDDSLKRSQLQNLFGKLRLLRDKGICELGVTTQLYSDHKKTKAVLPVHIQAMIGPYISISTPSIVSFPIVFPIVFPDKTELQALFSDVFPQSKLNHKKYQNNLVDTHQLYAHRTAKRDYFITEDVQVLKQKEILAKKWKIHVLRLGEYVDQHSHS